MQGPESYSPQRQNNKHIILILIVYVVLMISTHYGASQQPFNKTLVKVIMNQEEKPLQLKQIMPIFSSKSYEGRWVSRDQEMDNVFTHDTGKFVLSLQKQSHNQNPTYAVEFKINNGDYIDDGCLTIKTVVKVSEWEVQSKSRSIKAFRRFSQPLLAQYKLNKIMKTEEQKLINLQNLLFTFSQKGKDGLKVSIKLQSSDSQFKTLDLLIEGQDTKLIQYITFAILLIFTSYLQFSAIFETIEKISEGFDSASAYSFLTIMIATMWDAVICIIAFICAFNNSQNLLLFIIPAFLLCLLFTNFQLRFMLLVYQGDRENTNERELVFKFNLISYGSLLLIYPIVLITNFSSLFFIIITLFLLPQIYTNALQGVRPDLNSSYYIKFLMSRFMILFYMKCFPWNVFELEPNYSLTFLCFLLLVVQITFLWYQKQYGPKTIIPSIFLPKPFDYSYSIGEDLSRDQCSICLNPLSCGLTHDLEQDTLNKLMKTPCSHKYHESCLVKWMEVKMQCPQCRSKLPSYE